MKKNIILVVVLGLILAAIFYLESKVAHPSASNTPVVTITPANLASSTATLVNNRAGFLTPAQKAAKYNLAKEITTPDGFINTNGEPIKIADYIGKKVVLIDFWTYSCINCQRTVPYLEAWYKKYEDEGLIIVGLSTPEFEFEKDYNNVASGVKRLGITYPVVLDNDYSTWNAYQNQYWPREYLIDIDGYVVHDHAGEGDYDVTEKAIQSALKERAQVLGTGQEIAGGIVNPEGTSAIQTGSPETYFGSARNDYLGNGTKLSAGEQTLTLPETLLQNTLYLGGTWNFSEEYAQSVSATAEIKYEYAAKNIYFVASASTPVQVEIIQDGKSLGTFTIKDSKLYNLVQNEKAGTHTIDLKVKGAGLEAFTFTFG